ncbi:hypothetical protein LZ32DRAFT_171945 [Colletotrichum eremochloae]|nr:hypothetical protein LZ32DRAFT_171945 [Colletotrichum eremochloae]
MPGSSSGRWHVLSHCGIGLSAAGFLSYTRAYDSCRHDAAVCDLDCLVPPSPRPLSLTNPLPHKRACDFVMFLSRVALHLSNKAASSRAFGGPCGPYHNHCSLAGMAGLPIAPPAPSCARLSWGFFFSITIVFLWSYHRQRRPARSPPPQCRGTIAVSHLRPT